MYTTDLWFQYFRAQLPSKYRSAILICHNQIPVIRGKAHAGALRSDARHETILGFSITQAGEAVEADFAVLIRYSGHAFLGVQHDCQDI